MTSQEFIPPLAGWLVMIGEGSYFRSIRHCALNREGHLKGQAPTCRAETSVSKLFLGGAVKSTEMAL